MWICLCDPGYVTSRGMNIWSGMGIRVLTILWLGVGLLLYGQEWGCDYMVKSGDAVA